MLNHRSSQSLFGLSIFPRVEVPHAHGMYIPSYKKPLRRNVVEEQFRTSVVAAHTSCVMGGVSPSGAGVMPIALEAPS